MEATLNKLVSAAFVYNAILLISSVCLNYAQYSSLVSSETTRKSTLPYDYSVRWYLGPQPSDNGKVRLSLIQ